MPESLDQNDIDALVNQVQAGNNQLAADAAALDQAAKAASDIAGEIQAVDASTSVGGATGAATALAEPPAEPAKSAQTYSPEVQRLLAIEVPVIVQLGVRRMNVGEVMRFSVGAIIEFSKSADEELELLANNKAIGKGHAVKVGENFGIKLTNISPVKETIRKLGSN